MGLAAFLATYMVLTLFFRGNPEVHCCTAADELGKYILWVDVPSSGVGVPLLVPPLGVFICPLERGSPRPSWSGKTSRLGKRPISSRYP